jgi:SNF2 family DNA or RNA helicase
VNPDLPAVSYSTRAVDIPPAFRAAYDEMAADMIAHIPDTDEPLEVMSTLAQLQRLSQLASSACDVEIEMVLETREKNPLYGEMIPKYHVTMREPSWKIDELMSIMDEHNTEDDPLLVFTPHTQLLNLAGARAAAAGYRVGYITGQQTAKQKTSYRKLYQGGELDLLCCNVTAGGVGLTLNRGSTIVFIEPTWAFWQRQQSESRADDIANAKQVYAIDIVARNSVESRMREALKKKAGQLAELVRDPRIVEELLGGQPIHVK